MFDAGAAGAKLKLDMSEMTRGMLQANALMSVFPSTVTTFLANPLLGVANIAKSAAEAVVDLGRAWLGAITDVGRLADNMGELADKVGVSVDFLTAWGAAFADAGSSVEGFGEALKFLQKNAAEAVHGSETAAASFREIGISTEFLRANLGNVEAIMRRTADGLDGVKTSSDKTRLAIELLSRGGGESLAAFKGGSKAIDEVASVVRRLGGTVDNNLAEMGDKFGRLETFAGAALRGIQRAAAEPVLKALEENFGTVQAGMIAASDVIRDVVGTAATKVVSWGTEMVVALQNSKEEFRALGDFAKSAAGDLDNIAAAFRAIKDAVAPLIAVLKPLNDLLNKIPGTGGLFGVINAPIGGLNKLGVIQQGGTAIGNALPPSVGQTASDAIAAAQNPGAVLRAMAPTLDAAFGALRQAATDTAQSLQTLKAAGMSPGQMVNAVRSNL